MKTAISTWVHRADLSSYLDDIVTLGEKRIHREIRNRDMEAALSGTMSSGAIAIPSDYIGFKFAYVNSNPSKILTLVSEDMIYSKYPNRTGEGRPVYIAIQGNNFIFGPYPDSDYDIIGTYYKTPGTLSSAVYNLFTNNPDLFLFACLSEARAFIQDDKRIPTWENKYASIKDQVNAQDEKDRFGGRMRIQAA